MVSVTAATTHLGLGHARVLQLIRSGDLAAVKRHGRWYLSTATIERFLAERAEWMPIEDAAVLAGVTTTRIRRAITEGRVEQRVGVHGLPTLSRASVEAFVPVAREERRLAARRTRAAARRAAERRARSAPPDDVHTWLTTAQAGHLLGVSRSRVGQLIEVDLLPHERRGHRVWIREDLLRLVINARTARRPTPGD